MTKVGSRNINIESSRKQLGGYIWKTSVLICGSIIFGTMQPAKASHHDRPTMRDFRSEHSNLSRQDARSLFRETYGGHSTTGVTGPSGSNHKVVSPNHHHILFNEPKIDRAFRNSIQNIGAHTVRLSSGVDLDLTSSEANIVLGGNLFKNVESIEITVGGAKQTFAAGSKATAAEYVAIKQALSGAGQKLTIDQSGIASGGTVDLVEITSNNDTIRASSLTVAAGVTTYGDFGRKSDFTLRGDLTNFGSIVTESSAKSVQGGAIRADDITNNAGASITSSVDLELNARGNLSNYGSISSDGNLTLAAGNSIDNKGSVSANKSVNLNSSTINNSSTIQAVAGDINIDGPAEAALTVNNTQGILSAINGAINVRTPSYNGTFDNNIYGGDLLSTQVNLFGGQASNYVNVNALTGSLSQTGVGGHVVTHTDNLVIGNTCLTGDPTYFNFGDITVNAPLSVGEALTIVATQNIFSTNGSNISAGNATTGFDVTLVAGANITNPASGGAANPSGPGTAITLDGTASATGGSIILGTMSVSSSPLGASGNGGNMSFFAFQGASSGSGRVDVNSAQIFTRGTGTGTNGNLTIVAGGPDSIALGTSVQIGSVNMSGGTGGGGNLSITTAQPTTSGGAINYNADGTLAAGGHLVAGATVTSNATIGMSGGSTVVGGNVAMTAGKDIIQASATDTLFTDNFNAAVSLSSGGNIGSGAFNPFIIEGFNELFTKKVLKTLTPGNCTLSAVSTTGQVDILRNASTNLILQASSGDQGFAVRTNSLLNIAGNVSSANGAVRLENTGGNLSIGNGVQITAGTNIDITNGTTKKLKPTFTVGTNAQLTTTPVASIGIGDIFLTLDPSAFQNTSFSIAGATGRRPPTYSTGGFFDIVGFPNTVVGENNGGDVRGTGKEKTFSFLPPTNFFTANGAIIELNGIGKKGSFVFQGGVQTTAGQ